MKFEIQALLIAIILVPSAAGASSSAADLYKTKCVMCHGADGSGNTPMGKRLKLRDLRSETVQAQTDTELLATIENGKGKMPGQKGRVAKDDLQELVRHVRDLAKKH